MSTRTNVVVKDAHDKLWFYRHSDGYPSGTCPTLIKFMEKVADGTFRRDAMQAAGWLVVIGNEEYRPMMESAIYREYNQWKVGAYEPTTQRHVDIEYLYILDLVKCEICAYKTPFDPDWNKPLPTDENGLKEKDRLLGKIKFSIPKSGPNKGKLTTQITGKLKQEMQG